MRRLLPLLAALALPGCIVPIPVPLPEGVLPEGFPGTFRITLDPGDSCGARSLQSYVGQDVSVVEGTRFQSPGPVQIIRPGESGDPPARPDRVSFVVDASGTVTGVGCG